MSRFERCLFTCKEVCTIYSIPRSTLYDWISKELFPKPILVGLRSVRWRKEDLEDWLESRAFVGGDL